MYAKYQDYGRDLHSRNIGEVDSPVTGKLTDCSVVKWTQFTLSQLRLAKAAKTRRDKKDESWPGKEMYQKKK